jgi:hypothetical protein
MRRMIFLASMACACASDDGASAETDGGTTDASSSPSTSSTTGPSSSTDATASGSGSTSSGNASSEDSSTSSNDTTTTGNTSSSGSSGSSSSDGSGTATGPNGDGIYAAIAIPGGLDRIRVTKRNDDDGTCTWAVLVTPSNGGVFAVTVTDPWTVESMGTNNDPDSCDDNPPVATEDATSATGTIDLDGVMTVFPCTVDIDVTIDFPSDEVAMIADDIPVTGC